MEAQGEELKWPNLDGITDVRERGRVLGDFVRAHPEVVDEAAHEAIAADAVEPHVITSAAWNENLR